MSSTRFFGLLTLASVLVVAAFLGWRCGEFDEARRTAHVEVGPPTTEQIQADLQLRVELKPAIKSILTGEGVYPKATLVNTSQTRTHRVVKPGHGSQYGYREPYLHWTATTERDGIRTPVEHQRIGHCGLEFMHCSLWPKDGILLAPGEHLALDTYPHMEFQQAGHVRLQLHYDFAHDHRGRFKPEDLGPFAHVPPFKITSAPVEFDVVRPLDVRIKVKRSLKAEQKTRLSELLDVTLTNQAKEPVELTSPTLHADARVYLEIRGEYGGWRPHLEEERSTYGVTKRLPPGQEMPLLGPTEFANGIDGTWVYPAAGPVRIRAGFCPTTWKYSHTVLSDWAEVQVVE